MNPLSHEDQSHFEAAEGWLFLGDVMEANAELDNITPLFRAHPDVLALRWSIYAKAGRHDMAFEVARGLVEWMPEWLNC